jgi:hypothetical protein
LDGHTSDINLLIETININSGQIKDLAHQQRFLEIAVGDKLILSQLDRDKIERHEAEMSGLRQRLKAIETASRQPQDKPLPRKDELPLSTQVVLWIGALSAAGAAIYSFIA